MVNDSYKGRAKALISKAKSKGLVQKYSDFCKSEIAKRATLSSEEVSYYTSRKKGIQDE